MTEIKGDLISREALKRAICIKFYTTPYYKHILDEIDNAPTVDAIPDDKLSPNFYDAGYAKGLEDGKAQAKAEAVEYEYIAIRSYTDYSRTNITDLDKALGAGYEFVRASEVVKNNKDYSDYIEYILRRRKHNG